MLYADDAGIVSRPLEGLERMMTVIVNACSQIGFTVSQAKTEIMRLQTKSGRKVSFTMDAAGHAYKQSRLCAWAGLLPQTDLSIETTRRLQSPWVSLQRYKMETYDRPGVRLLLKERLLKAEVVETLLHGCMTWSPKKTDYDRIRRIYHSMLVRCLGWRKRKRDDYTLSYADALAWTASDSIEAIVRKRRILLERFVPRMGEERLPQRVMFGEFVGGKGYSGGQEKDCISHLKEDISVVGMKFEGWRKASQKAGRRFRRVGEGAELLMQN